MMDDLSHDDVARLLQGAGARSPVPAERTARVKAAVHDAWADAGRSRARRRVTVVVAAGALGAAAAVAIAIRVRQPDTRLPEGSRTPVARIAAVAGTVSANGSTLRPGDEIANGTAIRVADASLATVSLDGGGELRLDSGTAIAFGSRRSVTVQSGAVYVDTGRNQAGAPVVVRTAFGEVRDVGTRFEVRIIDRGWRARVRDGAIRIDAAGATRNLVAGREVMMQPDGAAAESVISAYDAGWSWTTRAARPFQIEGATVGAFLQWATDESGRHIRFADLETERALSPTTLHGSIAGLTAEEALDVVLPTCGLTRTLSQEQIVVSRSGSRE
jgi:FecR protein